MYKNFINTVIKILKFKTSEKTKKPKLKIKGKNNIINYEKNSFFNLKINIYGNDNHIEIKTKNFYAGRIYIGTKDCPASNCKVIIGENTTSNGTEIWLMEDNSEVKIGNDVMFSDNIYISCTDTHSIIDFDQNLLNYGKSVSIGNHCWIGKYVKILKNTKIPDNSVIALGSIITKAYEEENTVIAGNPAKIVKRNINWSRQRPNNYKKTNL